MSHSDYDDNELYEPQMCVLLSNSGMQQTALACDHCVTGPARCQAAQKCQAAVLTDGETNQYIFAKSTSTATLVSKEKDCFLEVKALVIGGGGNRASGAGGGGSGYVEFGTIKVMVNETLSLSVGSIGQASSFERSGQVLLLASAGDGGSSSRGGDGYTGGGSPSAKGGEDGGDGDSSSSNTGGHGSGLDIGSVNMTNFELTPGKGGMSSSSNGGGGGGVIVNEEQPSGENDYQGEGFGGGSGYGNGGRSGCVLIEV